MCHGLDTISFDLFRSACSLEIEAAPYGSAQSLQRRLDNKM
jgi:hypothetical protein